MLKGSNVVFVAYVHNIDTFNAMSKGLKGALTVLIVTHVKRIESGVCGLCTQYRYIQWYVKWVKRLCYVHNKDTFNAMSKGSKDYVMLRQEANTFLLIAFLIFNQFSI